MNSHSSVLRYIRHSNIFENIKRLKPHCLISNNLSKEEKLFSIAAPITLFWLSLTGTQRIFGLPLLCLIPSNSMLTCIFGATVVSGSILLSEALYDHSYSHIFKKPVTPSLSSQSSRSLPLLSVSLGLAMYCIFTQGDLFRTALPSSITSLGVFSKDSLQGYVLATGERATETQRRQIQILGKRYGCHHCGGRQLLVNRGKGFIADHMPPTGLVEKLNNHPWRRLLGLQVKQKLYPQCQKCFRVQGSAVRRARAGLSLLSRRWVIYHNHFHPYHVSYLLSRALYSLHAHHLIQEPVYLLENKA